MTSRRAFLRAAAGGALATPLVRSQTARAAAAAAPPPEYLALSALLPREDAAAEAYALAARRTGDPLLARLAKHCRRHAAALRTQLDALTRPAGPPPPGAAQGDPDAAPLTSATTRRAARAAAADLERALVTAAAAAAADIVPAGILQTVASIAAGHQQQLVALWLSLGRDPVDEPIRRNS